MDTIKEMPWAERPRERLRAFGSVSLSTTELLAILIQSGTKEKTAIELAADVMKQAVDLEGLAQMTLEELKKIPGIGEAKAVAMLAAIELGRRSTRFQAPSQWITSAKDVYQYLGAELAPVKQEHLVALYLDLKSRLIAKETIFIGGLNASLIHPREVFKYAVKYSANAIILVHNHPSGDPTPSRQDLDVTKSFQKAGELLQIHVVDHVVIGKNGYISIFEHLRKHGN
ncbi:MAG: DNA repair protein RadC [Candidatus Izemoplasmatales bacterium]